MELKLKFLSDTRKVFKKDEELKFDFTDSDVILLVGSNGSGKSTLIDSIRSHKCSNRDEQDFQDDSLNYSKIKILKESTEFSTDFDKIYFLSSEFDDPLSMSNTYSAMSFVNMGGFYTSKLSKGQRSFYQFNKFMKEFKSNFNGSLLIFDEIDSGMDLKNQIAFFKLLPKMCEINKCKCLCVTHCAIPFIIGNYNVFDLENKKFTDTYFNDLIKN